MGKRILVVDAANRYEAEAKANALRSENERIELVQPALPLTSGKWQVTLADE
jgi:hypothetical protein